MAALLQARRERLDQHADLLGVRRLEEGVDPALAVEQPLGPQAEHEDDRAFGGRSGHGRGLFHARGLVLVAVGHEVKIVTRTVFPSKAEE